MFCIITSQRSGSTWLKNLLDSHQEIRCFGEMFLNRPLPNWPYPDLPPFLEFRKNTHSWRPLVTLRYLDELSQYPGGFRAVGFKLMYNQLAVFPEIVRALLKRRFRIIHLVRNNPLDVVISRQRMQTTGIHHVNSRQTATPVRLNVSRLQAQLLVQESMVKAARVFIRSLPLTSCEITYESLLRDRDATLNGIANFLEVHNQAGSYHSEMRKIATGTYRNRIANFDEVSAKLYGTRFARLLVDE